MAASPGGRCGFRGNNALAPPPTPQNLRKFDLLLPQYVRSLCGPPAGPLSGIGTRHAISNGRVRVVRTGFARRSPSHRRATKPTDRPHRRRSERGERSTKPGSTEVSWCRSSKKLNTPGQRRRGRRRRYPGLSRLPWTREGRSTAAEGDLEGQLLRSYPSLLVVLRRLRIPPRTVAPPLGPLRSIRVL